MAQPHPPIGNDTIGLRHLAFCVDSTEFAAAQRDLRERGIAFWFEDHDISHAIYFYDPDGYRLEITTYDVEEPDRNDRG